MIVNDILFKLGYPLFKTIDTAMGLSVDKLKIFKAIVCLIPILVVYLFISGEQTPQVVGHDHPVFKNFSSYVCHGMLGHIKFAIAPSQFPYRDGSVLELNVPRQFGQAMFATSGKCVGPGPGPDRFAGIAPEEVKSWDPTVIMTYPTCHPDCQPAFSVKASLFNPATPMDDRLCSGDSTVLRRIIVSDACHDFVLLPYYTTPERTHPLLTAGG